MQALTLRNPADRRTVLWVGITAALVAFAYTRPELAPWLSVVCCYFALSCGIIAHNHNHCPTFKSRKANFWFSNVISIFYGYPTFAWVPTHNLNHHKYTNAPGDNTATWRFTNRHNIWMALSYFFFSSAWQSPAISGYIKQAKANNRTLYKQILIQYTVWAGAHIGMLALGIGLYGVAQGMMLWALVLGLPAFFSLWTIMLFNYDQHAHTDSASKYAHSRSFLSPTLNFLLFNNGFHYVHHEHPGTHWTKLPALHAEVAHLIPAELQQRSLWWYWTKQYFVSPFIPSLATKQMGAPPHTLNSEPAPASAAREQLGPASPA